MIKQSPQIKKQLSVDQLIPSEQILISAIDAFVSIFVFSAGLALIIGDKPRPLIGLGLLLLSASGLYLLLKNAVFRSLGCIVKNAAYTCDNSKTGKLRIRVILHNLVSLSPFIGLIFYPKVPYALYLIILIYLLNFIGYKIYNRRIIDMFLRITIRRNVFEKVLPPVQKLNGGE